MLTLPKKHWAATFELNNLQNIANVKHSPDAAAAATSQTVAFFELTCANKKLLHSAQSNEK
jgi:hypothetical protein